ncbi:MAG TPA: hypothetical protein VG826_03445 [Pirellulales bacterium]|nr:hypothetical protein [Pirellulales bacterium]
MSRRFQFSVGRLLLATGWLSLSAAAAGQMWRTRLDPNQKLMVIALFGVFWAGLTGAAFAMTSPLPVRHSFKRASAVLAGFAAGIALVILMRL